MIMTLNSYSITVFKAGTSLDGLASHHSDHFQPKLHHRIEMSVDFGVDDSRVQRVAGNAGAPA
jgi:hypothetical protein